MKELRIVVFMISIFIISSSLFVIPTYAKTIIYNGENEKVSGGQWSLCWSPNGRYLAAASATTNKAYIFEYGSWKKRNLEVNAPINDIKFSPDGKYLSYGGHGVPLNILDTSKWNKIRDFHEISNGAYSISWSLDMKYLAFSYNNTIKVISTNKWQVIKTIEENYSDIKVSFSPDSRYLACGGLWKVTIYNSNNWSRIENLSIPFGRVHSLIWSPDNKYLVAGMGAYIGGCSKASGILVLWNTTTWYRERFMNIEWCNSKEVYSVSWNEKKSLLAIGTGVFSTPYDNLKNNISVKLYSTDTWQLSQEVGNETIRTTNEFFVATYSAAWSPDDEHLVTAYKDITIYGFEEQEASYAVLYASIIVIGLSIFLGIFVIKYFFIFRYKNKSSKAKEVKPKNENK